MPGAARSRNGAARHRGAGQQESRPRVGAAPRARSRSRTKSAERQRLEHHLHEPLLLVELARALGDHGLEALRVGPHRAEEPRVLEGHAPPGRRRRDARASSSAEEAMHVGAQDGEGPDGAAAHAQRHRQHRAQPARPARLRHRTRGSFKRSWLWTRPPLRTANPVMPCPTRTRIARARARAAGPGSPPRSARRWPRRG